MQTTIYANRHTYDGEIVQVTTAAELTSAITAANAGGGNVQIVLEDGVYQIPDTLYVRAPNVVIRSESGHPDDVIIEGDKMAADAEVGNIIWVGASGFTLDGVTLQKGRWHAVQFDGGYDPDGGVIRNSVLRDVYQQIIKVSVVEGAVTSGGLIENSQIYYSDGIGPNSYIGGIDIHAGEDWVVQNNYFANIASPGGSVAEHAIHFWNGSANNIVRDNVIVDSDRGIGFGLGGRTGTEGGEISGNTVYHSGNPSHAFSDVGVILENNAGTRVVDNTVILESGYPNAIEVRFPGDGNEVSGNVTNGAVRLRDGGQAEIQNNVTNADPAAYQIEPGAALVFAEEPIMPPADDTYASQ